MKPRRPFSRAHESPFALMASLACILVGLLGCGLGDDGLDDGAIEVVPVVRGRLRITVSEGGDLDSATPEVIRSSVEGRAAITFLAPEGRPVKKGDVLVRLDTSGLEERLNKAESDVALAASSVEEANANVEIQKKKNEENLIAVRTDLELSQQALDAYVKGIYPVEERELESKLTIAEEKLKRAEDKFSASQRLFEQNFISKTELEADQLGHNQAKEEVDIAKRRLGQLQTWTKSDETRRLESNIKVRKLAEARVKQENESDLKQMEQAFESRKNDLQLKTELRDKLKRQFSACEIVAPKSGLVVYARRSRGRGRDEPIDLGREVREREEILQIPDLTNMIVEVDIHESEVKKVKEGQRAWVKVDAVPDRALAGTVVSVSPVPSSQSSWLNPDLKVYLTRIKLDDVPDGLKPGMHAQIDIMVREIEDGLHIPQQAVRQSGSRNFTYVKTSSGVSLREIKVGDHNESMVEILPWSDGEKANPKDGIQRQLTEGELVYLATPPGAPAIPTEESGGPTSTPGGSSESGAGEPRGPHGEEGPASTGGRPSGPEGGSRAEMMKNLPEDIRKRLEEAKTPEERRAIFMELRDKVPGGRPGETAPGADGNN